MTTSHLHKYRSEPVWRPQRQIYGTDLLPSSISTWLFDNSSLTKRLQEHCTHCFEVKVLQQTWAKPMLNEAQRLKMRKSSYAFVRQVQLLCDNTPVIFARTVIPPHTLRGKQRRLARLGKKPLGAVLFADKSMRRTEMEIAHIEPGQQLYRLATRHLSLAVQVLWARRSVFYLDKHPLLVCEIFLPDIASQTILNAQYNR
ncbi:MAG: chorismate lyase [Gammaproteobacteria bacterium]|nr:chorismate lyase [Gammaproteobacteria bacterium]